MKLIIVVLNDPSRVEDVLPALVEMDVRGMVVIAGETAMNVLAAEAPLFAGLRQLIESPRAHNRTVFGITDDSDILRKLALMLKEVGFDITAPGDGHALLLDVQDAIGGEAE